VFGSCFLLPLTCNLNTLFASRPKAELIECFVLSSSLPDQDAVSDLQVQMIGRYGGMVFVIP